MSGSPAAIRHKLTTSNFLTFSIIFGADDQTLKRTIIQLDERNRTPKKKWTKEKLIRFSKIPPISWFQIFVGLKNQNQHKGFHLSTLLTGFSCCITFNLLYHFLVFWILGFQPNIYLFSFYFTSLQLVKILLSFKCC